MLMLTAVFSAYSLYAQSQSGKGAAPIGTMEKLTVKMMAEMQNCAQLTQAFEQSRKKFETTHTTPWELKSAALNALKNSVALLDNLACLPLAKSYVTTTLHKSVQELAYNYPHYAPFFQNMREQTYLLNEEALILEKNLPRSPGTLEFEERAQKKTENLKAQIAAIKKLTESFLSSAQ